MIRNFITFPQLGECHQVLIQALSTSNLSLQKKLYWNSSVPRRFRSTCCSNFSTSSDHAIVNNWNVDHLLAPKSNFDRNHFYQKQPRLRHRNACSIQMMILEPKWNSARFSTCGFRRYYSSSTCVPEVEESGTPIHLWAHETDPFGTINIDAPFHVLIKPLNPVKYPEMNRALVKLFVPNADVDEESQENSKLSRWLNLYAISTSFDKDQLNLTGKIPKDIFGDYSPQITCVVEIPIKYNINVKVEGEANVSVSNMESDNVFIRCKHGNCWLKSVKCGKMDVFCETGSLESLGVLQGNIRLGCGGDGTLKAKRLQGQNIRCRTVSGNIDIADIYAEETIITASDKTTLNLGSCHGKTLININSGNINIKSVEGNLEAITQLGDVDVVLTNTKKEAYVCSKRGDVTIGLPNPADMDLDLLAAGIQLTKDFTYLLKNLTEETDQAELSLMAIEETIGRKGGSKVTGDAKFGILSIKYQDWLSSMGLKFSED